MLWTKTWSIKKKTRKIKKSDFWKKIWKTSDFSETNLKKSGNNAQFIFPEKHLQNSDFSDKIWKNQIFFREKSEKIKKIRNEYEKYMFSEKRNGKKNSKKIWKKTNILFRNNHKKTHFSEKKKTEKNQKENDFVFRKYVKTSEKK